MTPSNWIQLLSIAVMLLLFMIPIIFYAGKLVAKLETIGTRLNALEHKMTAFGINCFTNEQAKARMEETDKSRAAMWATQDWLRKCIFQLCVKVGLQLNDLPEEKKTP